MNLYDLFLDFQHPHQYIYAGENHLRIYKLKKNRVESVRKIPDISLLKPKSFDFSEIRQQLIPTKTGLILNATPYIFNILEFEKLPFQERIKQEVVEWRLQKVFPEKIDLYSHMYFRLKKGKFLSVLIKKELIESIEATFLENRIELIYIGSSTVEIFNNLRRKKIATDFFVEIDNHLVTLFFLEKGTPFYIRKFKSDSIKDLAEESVRTLNYLKKSTEFSPRFYSLISCDESEAIQEVRQQLENLEMTETTHPIGENAFIPRI